MDLLPDLAYFLLGHNMLANPKQGPSEASNHLEHNLFFLKSEKLISGSKSMATDKGPK